MSLQKKQSLFTQMVAKLIEWAFANGFELTIGEAFRTDEQQEKYLKNGKSKIQRSKHQDRLAIDLNLFIDGKYQTSSEAYRPLGGAWKDLGGIWGGDWKGFPDGNHFEL